MVPVSSAMAWAIVCGLGIGLGLWSLVAMSPPLRRPRLADRIAPYLVDVSPAAREHVKRRTVDPLPLLGSLAGPVVFGARSLLSRMFGGPETAARRLRQSGSSMSVERLRAEQVAWAAVGAAVGIAFAVMAAAWSTLPTIIQVAAPFVGAFLGAAARDWLLNRSAKRRLARITDELPTVLEFITLSLSAGEGILDALRRIASANSGQLAGEFGRVVSRVGTGVPVATALSDLSTGLALPALSRAIDQLTAALERGTPLAAVLRAQAQDARGDAKNRLLETAGRKEVAMLIPLVFLILPLTVVIAIFPGLFVLQAGF